MRCDGAPAVGLFELDRRDRTHGTHKTHGTKCEVECGVESGKSADCACGGRRAPALPNFLSVISKGAHDHRLRFLHDFADGVEELVYVCESLVNRRKADVCDLVDLF